MNTRKLPTELTLLASTEAGEVVASEPNEVETLLDKWQRSSYRGSKVLDIPPREWLSPGWLPADSVLAVYAPPGVGKSFYALSLALEMARGGYWVASRLTASPVLYVAAERATELRDRAEAWACHYEEELPYGFELLSPERPPQLTNPSHVEALCRYVSESGSKLVVLDTYARMTLGLEENSSKDTGPVLEALDRIRQATSGGAVLVVHHTGKDSTRGLRGSSAFLGAVDMTISLEGSEGILKAKVEKSNAGPEPIPEWYKLEGVALPDLKGEARSSAVLIHSGPPPRNEGIEEALLELLDSTPTGSMTKKELLEALAEGGRKVSATSLDRLGLRPLKDRGLIRMTGNGRAARWSLTESA